MKTKQLSSQFNLNKETIADLSALTDTYLARELNKLEEVIGGAVFHTAQASCRFDTFCC